MSQVNSRLPVQVSAQMFEYFEVHIALHTDQPMVVGSWRLLKSFNLA